MLATGFHLPLAEGAWCTHNGPATMGAPESPSICPGTWLRARKAPVSYFTIGFLWHTSGRDGGPEEVLV